MKENYVTATLQIIESGADIESVLSGLTQTLQRAGHEKLHLPILKAVADALQAHVEFTTPLVTLKDTQSSDAQLQQIQSTIAQLANTNRDFQTKIDPTIIGGFTVEYNRKLIDKSYKTKLTNLYQAVTK